MREQNQSQNGQSQMGEFPPASFPMEMARLWQENMVQQLEFIYHVNERVLSTLPYLTSMAGRAMQDSFFMDGRGQDFMGGGRQSSMGERGGQSERMESQGRGRSGNGGRAQRAKGRGGRRTH